MVDLTDHSSPFTIPFTAALDEDAE
jgi:hypothetical protein